MQALNGKLAPMQASERLNHIREQINFFRNPLNSLPMNAMLKTNL